MQHTPEKTSCAKTQFPELPFCGQHAKHHGVQGLSKHYDLRLDTKFGHRTCEIWQIICACMTCANMLDKTWYDGVNPSKQTCYQPVVDCTYWPVLGSFNDWNIIQLFNKTTSSEAFDDVHKVVLYGTSANMDYLVRTGKYGEINASDPTTLGYYVAKYVSDLFTLWEEKMHIGR